MDDETFITFELEVKEIEMLATAMHLYRTTMERYLERNPRSPELVSLVKNARELYTRMETRNFTFIKTEEVS